jgi:hypothetical protein
LFLRTKYNNSLKTANISAKFFSYIISDRFFFIQKLQGDYDVKYGSNVRKTQRVLEELSGYIDG